MHTTSQNDQFHTTKFRPPCVDGGVYRGVAVEKTGDADRVCRFNDVNDVSSKPKRREGGDSGRETDCFNTSARV
jgi:hypothetical protein